MTPSDWISPCAKVWGAADSASPAASAPRAARGGYPGSVDVHGYGGYGGPQRKLPRPASERTLRAGPVPRPASHEVLRGPRAPAVENLRLAAERSAKSVREGWGSRGRIRISGDSCPWRFERGEKHSK